jgi:hypothetical protein
MNAFSALVRIHLPQWLAREAAPGWVMAGTMAVAGLGATALATMPRLSAQAPIMINASVQPLPAATQVTPTPAPWGCQTVTLSNGHTHCMWSHWRWRHAWYWGHHGDWQAQGPWGGRAWHTRFVGRGWWGQQQPSFSDGTTSGTVNAGMP